MPEQSLIVILKLTNEVSLFGTLILRPFRFDNACFNGYLASLVRSFGYHQTVRADMFDISLIINVVKAIRVTISNPVLNK